MRMLFFTVERLKLIGAGKIMVAGRNCRDELRKGDKMHVRRNGEVVSPDVFLVDEITWYNRTVDDVPHGHTAGLFFPDSLVSLLRLDDELHGQASEPSEK